MNGERYKERFQVTINSNFTEIFRDALEMINDLHLTICLFLSIYYLFSISSPLLLYPIILLLFRFISSSSLLRIFPLRYSHLCAFRKWELRLQHRLTSLHGLAA